MIATTQSTVKGKRQREVKRLNAEIAYLITLKRKIPMYQHFHVKPGRLREIIRFERRTA